MQWLSVTLNNNRGLTAKKTTRPTVVSLFSKTKDRHEVFVLDPDNEAFVLVSGSPIGCPYFVMNTVNHGNTKAI